MKDYKNFYKKICKGFIIAEIGKNYNGDIKIASNNPAENYFGEN